VAEGQAAANAILARDAEGTRVAGKTGDKIQSSLMAFHGISKH